MKEKREAVSQGGTQPLFMIPQIVNPGSNYLPLVHNRSERRVYFTFPPRYRPGRQSPGS